MWTQRIFRSTLRANESQIKKQPTKFRVLFKSKSGLLQQSSSTKSLSLTNQKVKSKPLAIKEKDIKQYVKQMKMKTQKSQPTDPIVNSSINNAVGSNKQVQQKKQHQNKNQLSISRALSLQQAPSRISNLYSSFYSNSVNIQQIEKRVDRLITSKLLHAERSKNSNKNDQQKIQIDQQISEIVKVLQRQENLQNEENLDCINRKIGILQKIMAESMAQSEMAKKYYFKTINNKKGKRPRLNEYGNKNSFLKQRIKTMINQSTPVAINMESTHQLNFKAPDKKSYPERQNKTAYHFRNQPIHRSTYGCDFLVYGSVPSYPYKQAPSQIIPPVIMGNRQSSYQNQFTQKKIEKINIKQLDAYKDKFKNIQVPFVHLSNRGWQTEQKNPKQENNKQEKITMIQNRRTIRYKTQMGHYIKNLSTQNRISFKGQDNKIKSSIKHKNLSDLKYKFKATLHA